jgi:hypothetical protein
LINADASTGGAIGNNTFNNAASNGLNGSAIRMTGASSLLVINNDFITCAGNILGQYDWDNITIDGNHFTGGVGGEPISQLASIDQGTDPNRGRNIVFQRNIYQNVSRTGIETGGDAGPGQGQVFTNMKIDNNWFVDLQFPPTDGAAPISVVARASTGLVISNNYFRRGDVAPAHYSEATEVASAAQPADIHDNLIVGFAEPFARYNLDASSPNVHDNMLYQCGDLLPGNTILTADPGVPAPPQRIAW